MMKPGKLPAAIQQEQVYHYMRDWEWKWALQNLVL